MALRTQHLFFYVLFLLEPFIFDIENYETIYSNDLTKIERKKPSVVFSESCISEIENYIVAYLSISEMHGC
jgi:hypothetical protein